MGVFFMITLTEIQKRLATEIKNSGISQTELAKLLGIKQPTIGQYISGRAMPALDTFANLCVVLDVDPAEILGTSNADNKKSVQITGSFNNNSGSINFKA